MGANLDEKLESQHPSPEPVRWLGRDPLPADRLVRLEAPVHAPAEIATGLVQTTGDPADTGRGARTKWIAAAALIAIAIAAAVAWKILGSGAPGPALASRESIPLVTTVVPANKPITSTVTFTGTIAARYDMPIGIQGDPGRIVSVNVEAGDRVKRGQLMAKLDDTVLVPQVNRLAASLEQARAQSALSEAEYRRAKGVESAGALSTEEIEKRRAAAVTDAASVKVAAAMLAEAEARLERTRVVAPENGVVLTRKAEVGQTASPGGDPLFRLASGGEIEMRGQVAEQDLAGLKVNQTAQVYLTGVVKPFDGRVRLLGAVIDTQSRLGDIRIALKPDPALRPGAFARGSVITGNIARPILPQTAVLSDDKGTYVFVVNGKNQIERRGVTVSGTTSDGVIIAGGLSGTEHIVATAAGFLREGESVTVAPDTAGAPS